MAADSKKMSRGIRHLFAVRQQRVLRGDVQPPRTNDAANAWFLAAVDAAQAKRRAEH